MDDLERLRDLDPESAEWWEKRRVEHWQALGLTRPRPVIVQLRDVWDRLREDFKAAGRSIGLGMAGLAIAHRRLRENEERERRMKILEDLGYGDEFPRS